MSKSKFIIISLGLFVSGFVSAQTVVHCRDANLGTAVICEIILADGRLLLTDDSGTVHINLSSKIECEIRSISYYSYYLELQPDTVYYLHLQSKPEELGQVVISDIHGISTTDETVLNISRIERKQIDALGAIDLRDVLAYENNIRLNRDNVLGSSGLSLMGIGGNNVKIMINGVPVIGRMYDQLDLEQFNLENIQQVEVIKGPMSVIYGSNALAGTINIISQVSGTRTISARMYHESDGQYNATGTVNLPFGKNHSVNISGGRSLFRGWSLGDSDRTFDWIPKELYNFRGAYTWYNKKTIISIRSEIMHSFLVDRGKPLAPYGEFAVDQKYRNYRQDNSLNLTHKWKDSKFTLIASNNQFKRLKNKYFKDLITLNEELIPVESEQDTQYFQANIFRGIYEFDKFGFETLLGADVNLEKGRGPRILNERQSQSDYAMFLSSEYILSKNVLLRGGLRYAYNSSFTSPLLYSIQSRIFLGQSRVLKLAYGKGFRAPSIKEMFLDFNDSRHKVYGNASLHPETAHSFTLNYIQFNKLNKLGLSTRIEGFYNRINNKIELVVLGPIEATYNNIGVYETLGFALTERITYGDLAISTSLNYTGVYSGIAESERRFYFSPQIVITPSYHIKRLNMSVNAYLNYLGSFTRIFADTNSGVLSQEELDPYTTIDFSVRKQFFNKKIDVSAGFRNLLGVQNISATLTGVSAHTESTNSISISPGRTFFISIRHTILN